MVGHSFKEYNYCRICRIYYKKEDCPIFKNENNKRWAICPIGCSKLRIQTNVRHKNWKRKQMRDNPSKERGKMLAAIAAKKNKQILK